LKTRQTAAPLEEYSLNILAMNAREVANNVLQGYTIVDPPYQRTSVWSTEQRIGLVESWCRGIPIPSLVVNNRATPSYRGAWQGPRQGNITYAVVDGRQRVETAIAWFTSKLAVPASWFPKDGVETAVETEDGPYVRYSGLSKPQQRGVAFSFKLPCAEARLLNIEEEAHLYLLLNSAGTAQTTADLDRARAIMEGSTR
jgi:hypothetical protein